MKCLYCEGELKPSKEVYHVDRNGIHLTIDDMRVYKCDRCGEILVPGEEVETLQTALQQLEKAIRKEVA